jgi:hypothetical protein
MSAKHKTQKSKNDRKISIIIDRYYSLNFDTFMQEFKEKNSIFSNQVLNQQKEAMK